MKKTLTINISDRQFSIDEDAYQRLDGYLASIKSHFAENSDREDILAGIEERISEHFLESGLGIVSLKDVEAIESTMGSIDEIDGEGSDAGNDKKGQRRLYRDGDDVIIAGVASGLGHYFGIDPLIFRIIFFASIFAGGLGVFSYIILWLAVPEAKTASQKLSMSGNPVTLETLSEKVKERISSDGDGARRLLMAPFRIIGNIVRFLLKIIPRFLRVLLGVLFSVGGLFVLLWVMIGSGFFLSGDVMIFPDISLRAFMPGFMRYLILSGISLAIMLPALFVVLGGISLLRKKNLISPLLGFSLLGLWLVAITIAGFGGAKIVSNYQELVNTSPLYQETTLSSVPEGSFTGISVQNGLNVVLVDAPETTLAITGRKKDVDSVKAQVVDGTLVITRDAQIKEFCILCFAASPVKVSLGLSGPISELEVSAGSYVSGELPKAKNFSIAARDGSGADLSVESETLVADISNGSSVVVRGTAATGNMAIKNGSSMEAEELAITSARISASMGSKAAISIKESLEASAESGSSIIYFGNPALIKNTDTGSRIISGELD